MNLRGKILWFFGLSGSGKTTLANALFDHLYDEWLLVDRDVYITDTTQGVLNDYIVNYVQKLDGDIVRKELTKDLGFSLEDRFEHIRRVAFVADLLSQHGICVIASFITPLKAMRIYLQRKFGDRLILVYCDCSIEECIKRDVKGLYVKSLDGKILNMTGLTQTFEYPQTIGRMYDDMKYIRLNTELQDIDTCLESLIKVLESWDMKKT